MALTPWAESQHDSVQALLINWPQAFKPNFPMLSRIQRLMTLGLLLTACLWAIWAWRQDRVDLAAAGIALLFSWHAVILGLEFLLMHFHNRRDQAPRATLRQVFKAWLKEICVAPLVFCWLQPFKSQAFPDQDLVVSQTIGCSSKKNRGVVFVHGFMCNRGIWSPWLRILKKKRIPFIAINLEPIFSSIDSYAELINAAVNRSIQATGHPPLIVAHSMGGLATRAWLAKYKSTAKFDHIITIASPHQGTWLGRFATSTNTKQMGPINPWLNELQRNEEPAQRSQFTCFYSHCDNIVFPASNACLPGARNIHLAGIAHLEMAHNKDVLQEIFCRLDADNDSNESLFSKK